MAGSVFPFAVDVLGCVGLGCGLVGPGPEEAVPSLGGLSKGS